MMNTVSIRPETAADSHAIAALIAAAFRHDPHSLHNEHAIVHALRCSGELSVSLVAQQTGQVVGHVAVSPVRVADGSYGWYGLAPLAVLPDYQGQGIGTQLVQQALAALRRLDAAGCVVLGEPGYYARFGFQTMPTLYLAGVPAAYFQALSFNSGRPAGEVRYHPAFTAA